jgi:hypothetical protein
LNVRFFRIKKKPVFQKYKILAFCIIKKLKGFSFENRRITFQLFTDETPEIGKFVPQAGGSATKKKVMVLLALHHVSNVICFQLSGIIFCFYFFTNLLTVSCF